jgi:hypothetical protein
VVHSSWFIVHGSLFKSLGDRRPWCNSHTRHVRNPVHPQTPAHVPTYHVARQAHVHSRSLWQEFVGAQAYTHTSLSHTHAPVCDFRTFRHGCACGTFPGLLRSRLIAPITERHTRHIVALTGLPEAIIFSRALATTEFRSTRTRHHEPCESPPHFRFPEFTAPRQKLLDHPGGPNSQKRVLFLINDY